MNINENNSEIIYGSKFYNVKLEKIIKPKMKYEDYFLKDLGLDVETVKGINLNSYIISPIEVYNLKDKLKDDITKSGDYSKYDPNRSV